MIKLREKLIDGHKRLCKQKVRKTLYSAGKVLQVASLVMLFVGMLLSLYIYNKVEPLIKSVEQQSYESMSAISNGTFRKLEDTLVYDTQDNLLGKVSLGNYKYDTAAEISPYITNGYIAVEDRDFYYHTGISFKSMIRAAVALVRNSGEITQGGSTLTQQVLKNNVLNEIDNRWERKIVELYLAPQFEKKYSKTEIMEFYCNTNFYQNNCYGVEMASQYYFGKNAKNVTLGEAAILVGLSNNPAKYNPVKHPEACLEKRHRVLEDMLETGYITQDEFNIADAEPLKLILYRESKEKESYPVSFAIHCAALKQMELDGFEFQYVFNSEDEYNKYQEAYDNTYGQVSGAIRSGGYKIYTSINKAFQDKLQSILDYEMRNYRGMAADGRYLMQASATVVDNTTGYVVAIVGGRGTDDEYNRAYQAFRQPGSCAKPIVAYGPAFDTGEYYPSKMIKDEKEKTTPSNWDAIYRGKVSARESLERSINVTAFNVLKAIRPKNAIQYLAKMRFSGLSYLDTDNGSLAIGGFTYGTTTFEMSKAYSTIATRGQYSERNCIRNLEFNGTSLYHGTQELVQIYSEDTAYLLIDCLKGVLNKPYATGTAGKINKVIAFGKTGTTNSNKDGWFCGATVPYTIAVWAGYDTPKPVADMGGGKYPMSIYKAMMTYLMQGKPETDFERPDTIIEGYVDKNGNMTSVNTGKKDLFSGSALKEAEARRKEQAEKQAELEDRKRQAEQDALIESLKARVTELGKEKPKTTGDIEALDYIYSVLDNDIKSLFDIKAKAELQDSLTEAKMKVDEISTELRAKYNLEQEKLKEDTRVATIRDKQNRLNQASIALANLENWKNDPHADTTNLATVAKNSIDLCKDFSEYAGFNSRYETCLQAIRTKVANDKSELERSQREAKDARREAEIAENERIAAEQRLEAQRSRDRTAEIESIIQEETSTETTTLEVEDKPVDYITSTAPDYPYSLGQ